MSDTAELLAEDDAPERPGAGEGDGTLLTLALAVDDPALADRAASLLAAIPGLRLVGPGQPADLTLTAAAPLPVAIAGGVALTPREREVLSLMAEGASNKVIARALNISVHTAKFHVASVVDKLDATGRTDAVAHAARQGVIHL
ncbi:response regulator transcription factor [Roseomonas sp. CCTCC AB2023176]|uniref:response regulator transcription factor n=1 Tax=Roseomonas sp. CCTCC AB2023176 TaxID=3342640 RepID=UPI0035D5A9ED